MPVREIEDHRDQGNQGCARHSQGKSADAPPKFSAWSHKKDIAELMGHADIHMQFEYAMSMDENKH
jgi:hypothetical protein